MHCRYCRQDTLFKKHMVLAHRRRECWYLIPPPGLQADDGEEEVDEDEDVRILDGMELDDLVIEDRDLLESPRLHDLDNFEFGDGMELEAVDRGNVSFF